MFQRKVKVEESPWRSQEPEVPAPAMQALACSRLLYRQPHVIQAMGAGGRRFVDGSKVGVWGRGGGGGGGGG